MVKQIFWAQKLTKWCNFWPQKLTLWASKTISNREETNQHPDANTTPNKTKDPHSPLDEVSNNLDTTPDAREHTPSNVPSKYDTGMSDVVARHNPSDTYSNINGKDYTFAPGTVQTHRHVTPGRPDPEPPDKS